ncbi:hypothetical protein WR25_11072 isoform B [Diploscapter pachys]|uniref:non-specific serine/threonine protein kinase n=1 Tax=Diploscapter pachys TaxID=2018661 RepID=A0A2A2L370_9BILA|nr:hypothetical protein WR25_11072 isoform B [Diploscapter pachys]
MAGDKMANLQKKKKRKNRKKGTKPNIGTVTAATGTSGGEGSQPGGGPAQTSQNGHSKTGDIEYADALAASNGVNHLKRSVTIGGQNAGLDSQGAIKNEPSLSQSMTYNIGSSAAHDSRSLSPEGSESAGRKSEGSFYDEHPPQEEVLGSDDEEQEDPKDYRKGGYHPVNIGDVFHGRYNVLRKLGWGHFSTVWLCWDTLHRKFVALKIVKSADHYTEAALDEIRLLKAVREADPNDSGCQKAVQMLDDFTVTGVNGTHVCMVFEVLGCNLLKLIIRSNYQGLNLEIVRTITKQMLEGLRYLHEKCQIIHTDIKPENALVTMSHEEIKTMAQHAMLATKMNLKLSGSAVSTAPSHIQKKVAANMTKNKKKKMKKKQKKQRELLETQLAQMEGLKVDANGLQEVLSAPENENENKAESSQQVQNVSDAENANSINGSLRSPDPIERTSLSPPNEADSSVLSSTPLEQNKFLDQNAEPLSPSHPFSDAQMPTVLPTPAVGPDIFDPNCDLQVKIADLGNACWTHHHFTEDIQTRQYRALEVLIGAGYGPPADIWSTACMAFELATGDYLFEPHQGDNYSRDEDHLAHIWELLGPVPANVFKKGAHWKEFFSKNGRLLHIQQLKPWSLYDVLRQKYEWSHFDAAQFSSFLTPMLEFDQDHRVTAAKCLEHPFLKPFGSRAPPSNTPIHVLKRLYPDGKIPYGQDAERKNALPSEAQMGEMLDERKRKELEDEAMNNFAREANDEDEGEDGEQDEDVQIEDEEIGI